MQDSALSSRRGELPLPSEAQNGLSGRESLERGRAETRSGRGSWEEESGTKERFRKRSPRKHVSSTHTHARTQREAGGNLGHAVQAVAVERLVSYS